LETDVSEPMTDADLVNIRHRVACRYVFRDDATGEMWIDGGALQRVDVETLLAEVRRLQDMYADLVEAARDVCTPVSPSTPRGVLAAARLRACLARLDARDPLEVFRPEGA
jgi:hypothetical protein